MSGGETLTHTLASDTRGVRDVTITAIRTTPINIPLEAPYRWSVGVFPGLSKTIVEVETSAGVVGIGEAPSPWAGRIIDERIAPRLIGADPTDLADCDRRGLPPVRVMRNADDDSVVHAFGGVEMAVWDVIGQLQGRSIADLLGGRVRDAVSFTEYFAPRLAVNGAGGEDDPLSIARYCARMQETHGATAFEGKVGIFDVATEVKIVREVRAAIGDDCLLRLDANKRWTVGTARGALREFERFGVASIEDPVSSVTEMVSLRRSTQIGFSSHDPQVGLAATLGVPDAFCINLCALGGIRRTLQAVAACAELGIDLWFYSPDTGVMNAAYLQVATATPWISQPSQTLLRWHTDDVIVGGPMRPENGLLRVPDGPGLGVTLDREALRRCHQRFLDDGAYDHYGDPSRSGYVTWA